MGFLQPNRANHKRQSRDGDGVIEPRINVARAGHDEQPDQWQQSAEDSVANVIGQRKRGVANARRKRLDEIRRNRSVHHRDEDQLHEDQADQHPRRTVGCEFAEGVKSQHLRRIHQHAVNE